MGIITTTLLAIVASFIAYLFYYAWKINQYFKEKSVPHLKPKLFIGNAGPLLLRKTTPGQWHMQIFKQFPNEPIIGYYDFTKPVYVVQDPELIEKIIIKDFVHFVDHGFPVDEKRNPLDSNLFTMTGKRWKAFRNKLSPCFTTGKLKTMLECMTDIGDTLRVEMDKDNELEMRDILGRFAMDVIGSCAFGIDGKNLAQPDNEFRRIGKTIFQLSTLQFIKFILILNVPILMKLIGVSFNRPDALKYYGGIIRDTLNYRRENNYHRNDFVQLMMQLQDKGFVEMKTNDPADDYLNIETSYSTEKFEISNEQIVGQCFTFLTAGFEATTLSMMYTLYELAKNPDIQKKVQDEIQTVIKANENSNGNGKHQVTYDLLKDLVYLEQCINEAMRKYPPLEMLFRVCTKEYTLQNGVTIKPGETVMIALRTLYNNPKYYPEPEKYKPERFNPGHNIPNCAFLPFGNGPRICIAMRFAMMEMKYCLSTLLLNYNFKVSPKTKEPIVFNTRSFFSSPKDPIIFNVTKRTESVNN